MQNLGVLLVLILVSAIPAVAVFLWFRLARYPLSSPTFLVSLFVGASSVFIAIFPQYFLAETGTLLFLAGLTGYLFAEFFVRIAFTEELGRLLLLVPMFLVFRRLDPTAWIAGPAGQPSPGTMGRAYGFVAGLGFGILEGALFAVYNETPFMLLLLRTFTAIPLHAACGSRVGLAVAIFRGKPVLAVFQFLSAVVIHGIYNLMLAMPGNLPTYVAVFVAISALASSAQAIVRGMRAEDAEQ
ncbi:MAG: PrsW family intramembrane metalloprotease [Treponema sp.]|nr:PrsW family intramembrane metalloprotease [Treponema sp.]